MNRLILTLAVALMLMPAPWAAQQTAPEIESIRQEQLRADLFFLAGDAMRGRLTDTRENRMAAEWIKKNSSKPVAGFIAGVTAPAGKRMGHAGAIISGGKGDAPSKMAALGAAGVVIAKTPAQMGEAMQKAMKR